MKNEAKEKLEELVDMEGFQGTLEILSEICFEKAEHVLTNWQDKHLAKFWSDRGRLLDKILSSSKLSD